MGGFPTTKGHRERRAWPGDGAQGCDIALSTELVGVRRSAVAGVVAGDVLGIGLTPEGAAVCARADGEVVGALAAFENLARLLDCLADGVDFVARVEEVSPTRCRVAVARA